MSDDFKRQKWWIKRVGKSWRRPRGNQNKLRKEKKSKGRLPKPGYRTPRKERGLHPSGLREVMVFNTSDLEDVDPDSEAVRIGGSVGTRKRLDIVRRCEEDDITVLNPGQRVIDILYGEETEEPEEETEEEVEEEAEEEGTEEEAEAQEDVAEEPEAPETDASVLENSISDAREAIQEMDEPDYEALLEAEKEGKDRKGMKEWLESQMEDD